MSRRIELFFLLVLAILLPALAGAVHLGQSPDEVRSELGSPNGIRSRGNSETWVYSGDITIEFENDELVRAKGLLVDQARIEKMAPKPEVSTPTPVVEATEPVVPDSKEPEAVSNAPVMQDLSDTIDEYQHLEERAMAEFGDVGEVPQSATFLERALALAIPVFLTYTFLLIAFKLVGAEALKVVLLLISIIDLLVVQGVRWFFLSFLEFPMTFHADLAVSIIVMLALITKWTHAKQLPTAIRVVVASKIAGMVAFWLLAIFVLHNL